MRLERVAWLTALKPITVAGPRPIFTALPRFSSLQIVNSVYGAPPTLSIKAGLPQEFRFKPQRCTRVGWPAQAKMRQSVRGRQRNSWFCFGK